MSIDKAQRIIGKKIDLKILQKATTAFFSVASSNRGVDCIVLAGITIKFLESKGFNNAKLIIGDASWRVDGKDDGSVITHCKQPDSLFIPSFAPEGSAHYHAWISLNGHIFADMSTFQLPEKIRIMDKLDGSTSAVSWAPEALFFTQSDISTFEKVRDSYKGGIFYYKEDFSVIPNGEEYCKKVMNEIDPEDVESLNLIYNLIKNNGVENIQGLYGSYKV